MSDDKPNDLQGDLVEVFMPTSETNDQAEEVEELPGFIDLLYGVITKPAKTLRHIAESKPVFIAILLYATIMLINAIARLPESINIIERTLNQSNLPGLNVRALATLGVIAAPFITTIFLILLSGVLHLFAKLLKGDGDYRGLISSLGFASFPSVLAAPFILIYLAGGIAGNILYLISKLVFGIWVIVLNIIAIRENYKFSTLRAVVTYVSPLIILFVFILLLVISIAALLSATIGNGMGAFILGTPSP